jgi:hypothetical protein
MNIRERAYCELEGRGEVYIKLQMRGRCDRPKTSADPVPASWLLCMEFPGELLQCYEGFFFQYSSCVYDLSIGFQYLKPDIAVPSLFGWVPNLSLCDQGPEQ